VIGSSNIEFSDSEDEAVQKDTDIKIKYVKSFFRGINSLPANEWTIEQDQKLVHYLKFTIENQSSQPVMLSDDVSLTNLIPTGDDEICCDLLSPIDRLSYGTFCGRSLNDVALNVVTRLIKCGDYHDMQIPAFVKLILFCEKNNIEYVYYLNTIGDNTYIIKIFSARNIAY